MSSSVLQSPEEPRLPLNTPADPARHAPPPISPWTGRPAAELALAMILSGTIGVFVVQSGLDPVDVVFWRCVFGSVFMGGWCLIRGMFHELTWRGSLLGVLCGVFIVISWIGLFTAYRLISIATATVVYHIQPFFVVLSGAVFLHERITRNQCVWMLAAFAGVAMASGVSASHISFGSSWILGMLVTLGSAMLYALTTLITKHMHEQRPQITVFWQTLTGIVMLAPFAGHAHLPPDAAWGWLIGIGVIHTGLCFVLMYAAYPRLTMPTIGSLTFIYPLVAILCDRLVYGHRLTPLQLCGAVLIAVSTLGARLGWRIPLRRQGGKKAPHVVRCSVWRDR